MGRTAGGAAACVKCADAAKTKTLEGGVTVAVDEAYLKQSINDPKAKVEGLPEHHAA